MIQIAMALLWGLILSWFGFDHTVIQGAKEVFHLDISTTGYYFLFGLGGLLKNILWTLSPKNNGFVNFDNKKLEKK